MTGKDTWASYATDGQCHNANPGTYGHECGGSQLSGLARRLTGLSQATAAIVELMGMRGGHAFRGKSFERRRNW